MVSSQRLATEGELNMQIDPKDASRFWSHVDLRSTLECWEWTACRNKDGYGQFSLGGKTQLAHRVAWSLVHGEIPEGREVCHTCDHPPCCNTAHLFMDTHSGNMRDRNAKGRQASGERVNTAKLTEPQARDILALKGTGLFQREVAARYGVSQRQIGYIWSGKHWAHMGAGSAP